MLYLLTLTALYHYYRILKCQADKREADMEADLMVLPELMVVTLAAAVVTEAVASPLALVVLALAHLDQQDLLDPRETRETLELQAHKDHL